MTRWAIAFVISVLAAANMYSQKVEVEPKVDPQAKAWAFTLATIELTSPWIIDGRQTTFSPERRLRSCLDFESLSYGCERNTGVAYGDRIGVNWDLFRINGGVIDRTRMVEIGKYDWTDKFTVPNVDAWPALAPGEKRAITINGSGATVPPVTNSMKGSEAIADMNGNRTFTPKARRASSRNTTYATANVKQQVSSAIKGTDGKIRDDVYSPVVEVKKGYMYVVHVVDQQGDYYVLIHVDDVVHGESVKLSFIKLLVEL